MIYISCGSCSRPVMHTQEKERAMTRQNERKPHLWLRSSLPWAKHTWNESMFINEKYFWTFGSAFNRMNCSFDKSASDQGKRLQLTHRSRCTDMSWRGFWNDIFAKHGLCLTFVNVYIWSVSIFCNYCVAKSF